eukprot:13496596-Heterocapsa_arctica.AAC.1
MEEEQEMEEVIARGELSQRAVDAVIKQEAWYDEYTGKLLDPVKVKEAMDKELGSFVAFEVEEDAPERDARLTGAKIVGSRWIVHDRGPVKGYKARLVAREVNDGSLADTHAATPSPIGQRLLLLWATRNHWTVATGDVSTAFLHAPVDETVYIVPPTNLQQS